MKWSRKHELHPNTLPASSRATRPRKASAGELWSREAQDALSGGWPETASKLPDWFEMDLDGAGAELAFQDATALMSQDLTAGGSPFIYSEFLASSPPAPSADMFASQNLDSNLSMIDTSNIPLSGDVSPTSLPGLTHDGGDLSGSDSGLDVASTDISITHKPGLEAESRSSSNGPCALLHTLYRLSSPKSVRRLTDEDFVRYYFKHVCGLQSCFDSDKNHFRALTLRWWSSCRTISLTIQSAAIAHISNWYPYLRPLGVHKRCQAWRSLQKDLQLQRSGKFDLDKALLCLFLLGISASWQPSTALGLQYLHITRDLIQTRLNRGSLGYDPEGLSDMWAGALMHWEMLASFVDPVELTPFDGYGNPELHAQPLKCPVMPHPWTGISTELHFILVEIGRVSRRRRKHAKPNNVPEQETNDDLDHRWLQNLEHLLLTTKIPNEDQIQEYDDAATSKLDLIRTAKAYQKAGLLELYHVSPELLHERIGKDAGSGRIPFEIPENQTGYTQDIDCYLASIAVQTMDLIAQIPLSSGVCRQQPFLLVVCASQLRFPDREEALADSDSDSASSWHDHVVQHRYRVEAHMLALSRKLPQAPILRAMDTVKEVWDRLDGGTDAHWVGVMHDKGWQTILG